MDAEHVVERAEALRALRSARPELAARVALTQLHDTTTSDPMLAPLRTECVETITPEHCEEHAFDRLVEARLSATERRFDDDSDDGAGDLERAIEDWFGERSIETQRVGVRQWTSLHVFSSALPEES
ncbi:MAG: hypothetical protein ACI9KE_006216 [Polyangiales bacterium]|jgi:hypothetical protein